MTRPLWALLALLLTTSQVVAQSSDSSAVTTTHPLPYHDPTVVTYASGRLIYNFVQQVANSYVLVRPGVTINVTRSTDAQARALMQANAVDLGSNGGSLSPAQQAAQPDTVAFPTMAVGVVPVYNLPSMPAGSRLIMSALTLSMIFTGNITTWNHPRIRAENAGVTMPSNNITVVIKSQRFPDTKILSYAMAAIDPYWASTLGTGSAVKWPVKRYASYLVGDPGTADTYTAPIASVLSTPWSLTYSSYNGASDVQATIALMINKANATVDCTSSSLLVAATEKGVGNQPNVWADCSNANGASAWPICGYSYNLFNARQMVSTCEQKTEALMFINYMTISASALALATNMAILPASVYLTMPYPAILCETTPVQYAATNTGTFAGVAILSYFMSPALKYYGNLDSTRSYVLQPNDRFAGIRQVLNGEADMAILSADISRDINHSEWYATLGSGSVSVMPAYMAATAPIHNLPAAILNMTSPTFKYSDAFNGGTSLKVSATTLPAILMGQITQWNDPAILSINPALAERFAYAAANNITVNSQITLILCCGAPQADQTAGVQFFYTLYKAMLRAANITNTPAAYDVSWFSQIPFSYNSTTLQALTKRGAVWQMAQQQTQVDVLVQNTPGAIGYHLSNSPAYLPGLEFAWLETAAGNSSQEIVTYTDRSNYLTYFDLPSSTTDVNDFGLQHANPALRNIWPFIMLQSFVTLSAYWSDTHEIANMNRTLNVLDWLLFSHTLDTAVNNAGLVRVSEHPRMLAQTKRQLDYITCDGKNCLITLPNVWTLSDSIAAFGYAGGAIGLVLCACTAASLVMFKHRTVYRSASIAFLVLINLGLAMLFLSAITIVQSPPSMASCGAFAWLFNFGWALTFKPLFLKMYRIYKIFNRKQLRVVKLSNIKLLSYLGVLLATEIVVAAVWQGVAPLQPITTHVWQGVLDNQYKQCDVTSAGVPYLVILGVVKACFLLFGTVMSFSTRKVSSTFNESSPVGWSIYNAIFACVVIIAIVTFMGAVGDTLVLMELFLVFWVAYSTWAFIFGTKLFTIAQGEKAEAYSHLESQRTYTGGFSFVSIDALTKQTIAAYEAALEEHLAAVKRKRNAIDGRTDSIVSAAAETTKTTPYASVVDEGSDHKRGSVSAMLSRPPSLGRKPTVGPVRSPLTVMTRLLPSHVTAASGRPARSSYTNSSPTATDKSGKPSTVHRRSESSAPLHARFATAQNLFLSPLARHSLPPATRQQSDVQTDASTSADGVSPLKLPHQLVASSDSTVTADPTAKRLSNSEQAEATASAEKSATVSETHVAG